MITFTLEREFVEMNQRLHHGNQVTLANAVVSGLKAAGVPIQGGLAITGIERGSITISQDFFGNVLYSWSE